MGWRGKLLAIAALQGAVLVGGGSAAATPPSRGVQGPPVHTIFERHYLAVAVSDDSGGKPFEADRLALSFSRRAEATNAYDYSLAYTLQCNLFGAEMKVGPHRVWIKLNFQTEQGCSEEAEREQEWLAAFLGADPYWEEGPHGRLTLTAPEGTLELRPGMRKGSGL
jgi:hypothetical protein